MSPHQALALLTTVLLLTFGVCGQDDGITDDDPADTSSTVAATTTTEGVKNDYFSLCYQKNGKIPHPSNCRKYIICTNDKGKEKKCMKNWVFNEVKLRCDKTTTCNDIKSSEPELPIPKLAQFPQMPPNPQSAPMPQLAPIPQSVPIPQLPPILQSAPMPQIPPSQTFPLSPMLVPQSAGNTLLPRPLSPFVTQGKAATCPSYDGRWIAARNGQVPDGAVLGGNPLFFVGRAKYDKKHLVPCKVYVANKECYFAWGRKELSNFEYEVLTNVLHKWVPSDSNSPIPPNAIPGGYVAATSTTAREILYIGRAATEGIVHPGWVNGETLRFCHPYGGQSVCYDTYEVLVKYFPSEDPTAV